MWRKIFGEFMEFSLKGLNPFKIQTKFKCILVPEILIQLLLGVWTSFQKESSSFWNYQPHGKVWKIWRTWGTTFVFLQVWSSWNIGKDLF
jgi:hypothetical protein